MLASIEQTPAQLQAQRAAGAGAQVDLAERLRAVELVAVDLDGTLLNARKDVTPRTAAAIASALEVGVRVVPATGRVRSVLPPGVLGVPGMDFGVLCAGASVVRLGAVQEECESLRLTGFSPAEAADIVQMLRDRYGAHVHIDVGCAGELIAGDSCYERIGLFDLPRNQVEYIRASRRWVPRLADAVRAFTEPVGRINMFARNAETRREVMAWLADNTDFELANSLENNIEINAPGTSKWRGLMWLCNNERICPERVLALGDGANDVEMLSHAWLGVAMRNADDDAKAAARAVTRFTNEEEGVARVLEELVRLRRA